MIRWRALLDALRIQWRDRGANTSRGNVNLKCPWCGRLDPSHHLTINEETNEYYCYRAPKQHSGRSTPWLLMGLGVKPHLIDGILSEFSDRHQPRSVLTAVPSSPINWDKFAPADTSAPALEYMAGRGYPRSVTSAFDLRFTNVGRNSWRILMPLSLFGDVTGFTGRAIIAGTDPRYLMNETFPGSLYLPDRIMPAQDVNILLLCEGPFDALSVAVTTSSADVYPASILGVALPSERLLHIAALARNAKHVIYVPDRDHPAQATYALIADLRSACRASVPHFKDIDVARIPMGSKDLDEMYKARKLEPWLRGLSSQYV